MKGKIKNIIFLVLLVGGFAIASIGENPMLVSKADKDKEKESKVCTYGVEAVSNYNKTVFKQKNGKTLGNLKAANNINSYISKTANLFKVKVDPSPSRGNSKSYKWKLGYSKTDKNVKKEHFIGKSKGGSDSSYVDNVDLCFFVGHGFSADTCNAYTKGKYKAPGLSLNVGKNTYVDNIAFRKDMRLGNTDLEWFITFTCNFLSGSKKGTNGYGQVACGTRAICGFASQQYITANAAEIFCNYAEKMPVTEAWFNYALATNKGKKDTYTNKYHTAAYFTTKATEKDYLWGIGKQASKDPKSYSESPSSYYTKLLELKKGAKISNARSVN